MPLNRDTLLASLVVVLTLSIMGFIIWSQRQPSATKAASSSDFLKVSAQGWHVGVIWQQEELGGVFTLVKTKYRCYLVFAWQGSLVMQEAICE